MKIRLLNVLRFVVIGGALVAAGYATILARASSLFEQDTATSIPEAVRLAPHNSAYLERLAAWQPLEAEPLLERAIEENPFNYDALIRMGLLAEMQDGDNTRAEKYYLEAADVNHMFLPRWTLANFYFRQQRPVDFFHWSREALVVTPYASDPVFAQMWQMSQDPNVLNQAIPDRPRILLQYAWYLSNQKRYEAIPQVVGRLVKAAGTDDPRNWGRDDLLAVGMDHMLAAGAMKPALAVWSTLRDANWLHADAPTDRNPLTNGDFRQWFYRHGFDWVANDNTGTHVEQLPDSGAVRISLYGDQAEHITLLQQYLPAAAGQTYTLSWQAKVDEMSDPSGLVWHLHSIPAGQPNEVSSGDLLDSNQWTVTAPNGAKLFLLTLEYSRPLGRTRSRGSLVLESVKMEAR